MRQIRVTFSLPSEGELGSRLFAYSRFERSFLIKEALSAYFGIGTPRTPTPQPPPVAVGQQELPKSASVREERPAIGFLGDFADD
jgi:hypothetical protein